MTTWYLDTSAALKLVVDEAESRTLIAAVETHHPELASSTLLDTEMRRASQRIPALTQRHVTELLDRIDLYTPSAAVFTQAGLLPGTNLRSLDAIHLAVALHLGADVLVSYDRRMIEAARGAGLAVSSPAAQW